VPCTRSSGTLRIARVGDRFSVYDADGVRPLVEGQGSRTALYFGFYVEAGAGDPGGFRVTFDDLRLETSAGTTATPLGSIVETFDGELPDYLTKGGWAGIVGVSKGRLFLENFADVVGQSRVALRAPEFVLRGDFEVSFDYELVDWVPPSGRDVSFDVDLVDLSTHQLGVRLRCTPGAPPTASAGFGPKGEATPEPLSGRRGRLRLTRAGSRITVEYGGEEWRELAAADGPPADLHMMFNLSNSSTPGGATVAIDNLRIEGLVFTP
jgi:hypothetical protein